MSWFEEQIDIRKSNDLDAFEESCLRIAGSVMGRRLTTAYRDERGQATDAIGAVLKYYHVKEMEVPDRIKSIDEVLEFLLRPHGIMTREVSLKEDWRKDASGPMLTTIKESGKPTALIPSGAIGYKYLEPETGVMAKVSAAQEKLFSDEAIAFYKPFPTKALTMRDMYRYIINTVDGPSKAGYFGFAVIATAGGMLIPWITQILFSDIVSIGSVQALVAIALFMILASLSGQLFGTVQELFLQRISLRLNINIESATMMRILTLPSDFFKAYSPGDLAKRVQNMDLFVTQLINMGLSGFVTALFSFIYVFSDSIFCTFSCGSSIYCGRTADARHDIGVCI